jgi:hypothetical protein
MGFHRRKQPLGLIWGEWRDERLRDEPALVIHLTCVGQEDRIIEVRGDNTADRRRRPWLPRRTSRVGNESDQHVIAGGAVTTAEAAIGATVFELFLNPA